MVKCTPMQAIKAKTLESFNERETKMFLITNELPVSKLEFTGMCHESVN